MIYITGKGGKERLVPLSTEARKCLNKWQSEWNKEAKKEKEKSGLKISYLFPSKSKN